MPSRGSTSRSPPTPSPPRTPPSTRCVRGPAGSCRPTASPTTWGTGSSTPTTTAPRSTRTAPAPSRTSRSCSARRASTSSCATTSPTTASGGRRRRTSRPPPSRRPRSSHRPWTSRPSGRSTECSRGRTGRQSLTRAGPQFARELSAPQSPPGSSRGDCGSLRMGGGLGESLPSPGQKLLPLDGGLPAGGELLLDERVQLAQPRVVLRELDEEVLADDEDQPGQARLGGDGHLERPAEQPRHVERRVHPPVLVQPVGVDAGPRAVRVAAVQRVLRRHGVADRRV